MSDAPVPFAGPARPKRSCSACHEKDGRDSPRPVLTFGPRFTGADQGSSVVARRGPDVLAAGAAGAVGREHQLLPVLADVRLDVVRRRVVELGDRGRRPERHVAGLVADVELARVAGRQGRAREVQLLVAARTRALARRDRCSARPARTRGARGRSSRGASRARSRCRPARRSRPPRRACSRTADRRRAAAWGRSRPRPS